MKSLYPFAACLIFAAVVSPPAAHAQNIVADSEAVKTGTALYSDLRCGVCHNTNASGINVPPSLANAGDKFQAAWIEAYLQAPYRRRWESASLRPILRMPNFLLSKDQARALAAFLSARHDSTHREVSNPVFAKADSAGVAEGREIYKEYACYGCHKIAGEGGEVGPDLDGVGRRLRPEYLSAFLQDPQAFIPGSPMKNFDLWEEEVRALVAYLISLK